MEKLQDSFQLERLRQATNLYHHTITKSKKSYHANLVNASKSHPRKLWQTINTLLHRKSPPALPSTISEPALPNAFTSFFTDKITKLHSSLTSNTSVMSTPHTDPPFAPKSFNSFRLVTNDEILKLINQSQDKQCDLDPIPTSLLKRFAHVLVPIITNIVNLSTSSGTFPPVFKPGYCHSTFEKTFIG